MSNEPKRLNQKTFSTDDLQPKITITMTLDEFLRLPYDKRATATFANQRELAKACGKAPAHLLALARSGVVIPRYIVVTDHNPDKIVMKLYNRADCTRALELHTERDYTGLYRLWYGIAMYYHHTHIYTTEV